MWFYGSVRVEANMAEILRGKKVGRLRKYAGDGKALIDEYVYLIRLTKNGKGLKYSNDIKMMIPWHDTCCRVTMIPVTGVTNRLLSYVATKGNQHYSCYQFARHYFVAI